MTTICRDKKAIITGGSRGIGLAVAVVLARRGMDITIIARDVPRINEAISLIKKEAIDPFQKITGLPLDVSKDEEVMATFKSWFEYNETPDILINSAGFAHPGKIEDLSTEIFRKTMDVNYFGTVNMVKAVLPYMLARGTGHIVNISSVAGFLGIYGYTAYSGSKFAVTGFSDCLRNELKPRGINVSVVFPPDTDTEQLAYESRYKPDVTKMIAGTAGLLSPSTVAEKIVAGMEKCKYIITPGFEPSVIYWLHHFFGKLTFTVLDWMATNAWKKVQASTMNKDGSIIQDKKNEI